MVTRVRNDKGIVILAGALTALAVFTARWMAYLDARYEWLSAWAAVIAAVWVLQLIAYGWSQGWRLHLPEFSARQPAEDPEAGTQAPSGDAKAKGKEAAKAATAWDEMPVLRVPLGGLTAREAVLQFAVARGFQAFETARGYVLGDQQGDWYRVAVA